MSLLSIIASVSTKDNNESGLFFEARLFKSAASVESEVVAFLLERLNFVTFVFVHRWSW